MPTDEYCLKGFKIRSLYRKFGYWYWKHYQSINQYVCTFSM